MGEFAVRLRKLRQEQHPNVAVYIVSELCGLNKEALRRYERGKASPTAEALKRIATHYGVSVDYLLGLTDEKKGHQ